MYNGYYNYATWSYKLHIDIDYNLYTLWRERTANIVEKYPQDKTTQINLLMDNLRADLENNMPTLNELQSLLGFSDLIQYTIDSICYREIAEELLDEVSA